MPDTQSVAVAAGAQGHDAGGRVPHRGGAAETDHLLHFSQRGSAERSDLGAVAGRPGIEHEADPPAEVADRREHAAHRSEGAIGELGLLEPGIVLTAITMRQAGGRDRRGFESGDVHPQWIEDLFPQVARVRHSGHVGDDAAEDSEAEIGVLVRGSGGGRERNPAPHHPGHVLVGRGQLLVSPRIILGESFRV